jgi:ABC-type branched-subunit amino acid transport system substrate-binding protein
MRLGSRAVARRFAIVLLALLAVAAVSGCGRTVSTDVRGGVLTVYSASPQTGPQAKTGRALVTGEKLALGLRRGAVGPLLVKYVSLDSARGAASGYDPTVVTNNAQTVVGDSSAIAYLGDAAPGATRVSLPILSAEQLAVLSPTDPNRTLAAAAGGRPADAYVRGVRTGYTLAPLTDAQISALAGPRFRAQFRHAFAVAPNAANARGFVAMNLVLDAVKAAGKNGGDRLGVANALGPVVQRALRQG